MKYCVFKMTTAIIALIATCWIYFSVGEVRVERLQHGGGITSVKRSDGLMRDLVNLLLEEKEERKGMRSEMIKNRNLMMNLTREINTIKNHQGKTGTNSVGFTARLGTNTNFKKDEVMIFKDVISNYGNGYNEKSGMFTCKTPGLYIFHLHILSNDRKFGTVWLVRNGKCLVRPYYDNRHANGDYDTSSSSVVIKLKVGDRVWATTKYTNTPKIDNMTYFAGAMLSS